MTIITLQEINSYLVMEHDGIWTEEVIIRAFMVDATRRATLPAIGNFLQEVAGNHATFRRIGFYEMQAAGRFWALSRLRIRMDAYPRWQDRLAIQTWVSMMKGPFSTRNFRLLDATGRTIGAASTLWTAVDAEKRRPARLDSDDFPVFPDRPPLCGEPEKIDEAATGDHPAAYRVRYSDLDMVRHVNNVKYLEWILDTYGDREEHLKPAALDLNYLGETHLGDEVRIHTRPLGPGEFLHSIFLPENGKEVVRARLTWKNL